MARVFMDGFEDGQVAATLIPGAGWNNTLWYWQRAAAGRIGKVTNPVKSGSYCMRIGTTGSVSSWHQTIERDLGANIKEHYGRIELYSSNGDNNVQENLFLLDANDDKVAAIRTLRTIGNLVNIYLYLGNTEVACLEEAFAHQTWVRIEWHLIVDEISGLFELRRNGDDILSYSGDTKGANMESIRTVCLGTYTTARLGEYIDDFALNDTSGAVNNSWCGPGSILLLKPKGAGNYTQFTPDSGNNFARVNEIPHTSDSAYVESATADQIDTYEMQTLTDLGVDTSDPAFNIKAVQHLMAGRWDEAETKLSRVLRLGTTDNTGAAVALSNTYYRYWDEMFDVNPFDSLAWGLAGLNSLEAGVKHIAST